MSGAVAGEGRLAGRKILITGGSSGIGAETCRLMTKEGAKVAILARDRAALDKLSAETGAVAAPADLFDVAATRAAIDRAAEALDGLDGLVCNAGVSLSKPFGETALEDWRFAIDGNATSVYVTCHAALPYLQQAEQATIVNVGSAVGVSPLRNRAAYAASKAAVHAFTKVLAMELAPKIRCNVLSPGGTDTPMVRNTFTDPAQIARIEGMYALGRMGRPEEMAEAILFLTSSQSSFMTGSLVSVDGGRVYY